MVIFTIIAAVITWAVWRLLTEKTRDIDSWTVVNFSIQENPAVIFVRVCDRHTKHKLFVYRLYADNPTWVSVKEGRVMGEVSWSKERRLYYLLVRVILPNADEAFVKKFNSATKGFTPSDR
jgi:hypothetical protein